MSKPRRYWNYRIIQNSFENEQFFALHEVHYQDDVPCMVSKDPTIVYSEAGPEGLKALLEKMLLALDKPILQMSDFEK